MRICALIIMIMISISLFASSPTELNGTHNVKLNIYDKAEGGKLILSKDIGIIRYVNGNPNVNFADIVRDQAPELNTRFVELVIDGSVIDGARIAVNNAPSLRRDIEPGDSDDITEELEGELQIGFPGEELYVGSDLTGFGDDAPNERVTVDGTVSISHGTAPTATAGFGKVYVDASDGHLYYMEESGETTDLLETTSTGAACGSMAAVSGAQYDLCIGEPMHFPVHLGGGEEPYTHNWSGDTGPLSATDIPNPIFNAASAGIYSLTYTITDASGKSSYYYVSIEVHANPTPSISASPPSGGCNGQPVALDAGGCFEKYCWNNGPCDKLFNVTEPGEYTVQVIDEFGCRGTASMTVAFLPSPIANIGSAVGTCDDATNPVIGGSPSASGGSAPYFYEWTGSGAPYLSSTADANPTFDVTTAAVGVYNLFLEVTDDNGCTNTDGPITVTVYENPSVSAISNSPVCPGDELRLTATPSGGTSPYYYSWTGPGVFSSAAANPVIASATSANDGIFSVIVTDAHGCVSSTANTDVTVYEAPLISVDPINTTLCEGLDAGFSVTASGESITYQWQRNTGSGFLDITGATGSNLTVTSVTPAMDGYQYQCIVSGTCLPSATSATAVLNVNAAPNITVEPVDEIICDGESASFSITANGYSISYQWQLNSGSGWSNISGATSNSLNLTSVPIGDDGNEFRCIVSGSCIPADTSETALLTVMPLTAVTADPVDQSVSIGSPVSFSITADGYSLTYQWQINTGSGWTNVSGTSATYTISSATLGMDGDQYRCIVTGYCTPYDTSEAATLSIVTALYSFTSHTFTTCGLTDRYGPNLATCRSAYSTSWDENDAFFNMSVNGIQRWTVPSTGTYRMTVAGGEGGPTEGDIGGDGAVIQADFNLTSGEILQILVASRGKSHNGSSSGGGGGSFVVKNDGTPLIIAGGGGGGINGVNPGDNAVYTENSSQGRNFGIGLGGHVYQYDSRLDSEGGGAGGLNGNGEGRDDTHGRAFINGGVGGWGWDYPLGFGGFGGAGSYHNSGSNVGGGGGGYTGGHGNWGYDTHSSGGGGSYVAPSGSSRVNVGYNTGNGYVTIEKL